MHLILHLLLFHFHESKITQHKQFCPFTSIRFRCAKLRMFYQMNYFAKNREKKTQTFLFIFTVPSQYPNHPINPQPNQKHDQIIHQTTSPHSTTLPDTISHPINHNQAVYVQTDAGKRSTVATMPNYMLYNGQNTNIHDNNDNIGGNGKGIFMPVATNQYPIEQSSMDEDLRERFDNFVDQWTKAFVYLSRK